MSSRRRIPLSSMNSSSSSSFSSNNNIITQEQEDFYDSMYLTDSERLLASQLDSIYSNQINRRSNATSYNSAASLQSKMKKKYNLDLKVPNYNNIYRSKSAGDQSKIKDKLIDKNNINNIDNIEENDRINETFQTHCPSCLLSIVCPLHLCPHCGYFLPDSYLQLPSTSSSSCSVFSGSSSNDKVWLVSQRNEVIPLWQWESIELSVRHKKDDEKEIKCPICLSHWLSKQGEGLALANSLYQTRRSSAEWELEEGRMGIEEFGSKVVVLSCSHLVHLQCLQSLERFCKTSKPLCPMCRAPYQKKLTKIGGFITINSAATIIQKYYRRFQAMNQILTLIKELEEKNIIINQKTNFLNNILSKKSKIVSIKSTLLIKKDDEKNKKVDNLLNNFEETLKQNIELNKLFDEMILNRQKDKEKNYTIYSSSSSTTTNTNTITNSTEFSSTSITDTSIIDNFNIYTNNFGQEIIIYKPYEYCREINMPWKEIYSTSISRFQSDCAICMNNLPLTIDENNEKLVYSSSSLTSTSSLCVLLSCSHIFHEACLSSFERFTKKDILSCPICRSLGYGKRILK